MLVPPVARSRLIALAPIALALAGAPSVADEPPPLPGPGPRARVATVTGLGGIGASGSGACTGCHEEIAREWRGSLHRRAWVDPVFQAAYLVEPLAFCRSCHAPEADPALEPPAAAQDEAVGCLTCHVEVGHVLSARASGDASHLVVADGRRAAAAACAGCHQFDFPAGANQRRPEPMQDTAAEHARSRYADTPCQQCHMPLVDGPSGRHRSHGFTVLGDPAMLRRAARVTAERSGETAGVALAIAAGEVGHCFPTGDMFRRLEAQAEAIDDAGRVVAAAAPVVLARHFVDAPRDPNGQDLGFERVTDRDTRVPPPGAGDARRVELVLPASAGSLRVRWRLVYQRMSTPMASAFRVDQAIDTVTIAEGELPGRPGGPASPRPDMVHAAR